MKRVICVAILAALVLVGCGGGSDSDAESAQDRAQPYGVEQQSAATHTLASLLCKRFPRVCAGITGSMSGLRTSGLVLVSGFELIEPKAYETTFAFSRPRLPGRLADVRIVKQPAWQHCDVEIERGHFAIGRDDSFVVRCRMLDAIVTTIAGSTTPGRVDGPGAMARFNTPTGVAVDARGTVYVTEWVNNLLRTITPAGDVGTFVGTTRAQELDGIGTEASLRHPYGVTIAADGTLFVTTAESNIRRISPAAEVSTLSRDSFRTAIGIAVDNAGANLYVADMASNSVAKVLADGSVSLYAGATSFLVPGGFIDGPAGEARLMNPWGVAIDGAGIVYVADTANHAIRKVAVDRSVTTLAGNGAIGNLDGSGRAAGFSYPSGVAVDKAGNVYVADRHNSLIRLITPEGVVTTLAGSGSAGSGDGVGSSASFNGPQNLALDAAGNVYVADTGNHSIRKIVPRR
jgi:sugar lactone lactonase YvrE